MSEKTDKPVPVQLAKASWIAPLLVIGMNYVLNGMQKDGDAGVAQSVIFAVVAALMFLLGFGSGIVALFGIRKHGWRGILIPGIIGTLVSGAMLGVIVSNVSAARQRNDPHRQVEEAISKLKSDLPRMIDKDTEMTDVYVDSSTIIFEYRMPKLNAVDLDQNVFSTVIAEELRERYCQNMEMYWRNGFGFGAKYLSADQVLVADLSFHPSECE